MPTEASSRAYSATGARSSRTWPVFEEDAASGVAALDGTVSVVPFVDPADGHGGAFAKVGFAHVGALRQIAQQGESPVEDGAIAAADNIDFADQIPATAEIRNSSGSREG